MLNRRRGLNLYRGFESPPLRFNCHSITNQLFCIHFIFHVRPDPVALEHVWPLEIGFVFSNSLSQYASRSTQYEQIGFVFSNRIIATKSHKSHREITNNHLLRLRIYSFLPFTFLLLPYLKIGFVFSNWVFNPQINLGAKYYWVCLGLFFATQKPTKPPISP